MVDVVFSSPLPPPLFPSLPSPVLLSPLFTNYLAGHNQVPALSTLVPFYLFINCKIHLDPLTCACFLLDILHVRLLYSSRTRHSCFLRTNSEQFSPSLIFQSCPTDTYDIVYLPLFTCPLICRTSEHISSCNLIFDMRLKFQNSDTFFPVIEMTTFSPRNCHVTHPLAQQIMKRFSTTRR